MTRLHDRLDAAIQRAARRYFATFYFVSANGLRKKVDVVKRVVGSEGQLTLSGSLTARGVEFVMSRRDFENCLRLAGFGKSGASTFELLRSASFEEVDDSETRVYKVDASRPFDENSPDSGTVRIYAHWNK